MAVSSSFKFFVTIALAATLLPKVLTTGSISNPSDIDILDVATPFFLRQGYEVAGQISFAGRDALLVRNGTCLMYVVPVAHQGWHQATVRQSVGPTQRLWFAFDGKVIPEAQETSYPLATYYIRKAAYYLGFMTTYPPVLALVTDGNCSVVSVNWKEFPGVPFKTRKLDDQ